MHLDKHERIEIKFYNLNTFKKQIDVNFIDLDSELVDLNYKVESLIFCHFWRSTALSLQTKFIQDSICFCRKAKGSLVNIGIADVWQKSQSL